MAAVVIGTSVVREGTTVPLSSLAPHLELTAPAFTFAAIIGISVPLYLVTMASQNVPGVAVMKSYGFDVPWRRTMIVTGAGTVLGAPAGGHAINLAAITAALAAGPEAGEQRSRRWVASFSSGATAVVLGVASSALVALVLLAPEGVVAAVAGLALLGTLAASAKAAIDVPGDQIPAIVTFVMAASGVALLGVSAAFWALVAGIAVRAVLRWRVVAPGASVPADDSQ
jgi:benzoate membrane transport protein